jgi:leucyl-tRNA synthetase
MLVSSSWPIADPELAKEDVVTIVIQVNGKLRGEFEVDAGAAESAVVEAAKTNAKAAPFLDGKSIVKTIYVPGRLVNLVVK